VKLIKNKNLSFIRKKFTNLSSYSLRKVAHSDSKSETKRF
jgi:hypothetical protein